VGVGEIHLADRWFFVYKEHRKSRTALRLVKSFYERLGLSRVGSLYMEV